jgi:hypothetical protein
MHPKDRQKMCSSCDGRIPYDATVCPYCASEQTAAMRQHHQSIQESLTALYAPPYSGKSTPPGDKKEPLNPVKESMAEKRFHPSNSVLGVPTIPQNTIEEQAVDEGRSSFWPILLLSIGSNLLALGLLQLLFSDQGFLRLEWDSRYWFAYCLGAAPLIYFGFKKINTFKN